MHADAVGGKEPFRDLFLGGEVEVAVVVGAIESAKRGEGGREEGREECRRGKTTKQSVGPVWRRRPAPVVRYVCVTVRNYCTCACWMGGVWHLTE